MNRYPLVTDYILEKAGKDRSALAPDVLDRAYLHLLMLSEAELLVLFFQTDFFFEKKTKDPAVEVPPRFEEVRRILYPPPQLVHAHAA